MLHRDAKVERSAAQRSEIPASREPRVRVRPERERERSGIAQRRSVAYAKCELDRR